MFVEIHVLQNFAPSCLNRDDTNSPKDCEFGGHRRARISSQCIKRAMRKHFEKAALLPPEHLAHRAKRLVKELTRRLGTLGRAFLRASVEAIPTGKQNSMAAHNPPDLVLAVVRERGLWSLANAFVDPIRPDRQAGLVQRSAEALDRYWGRLARMYPDAGVVAAAACVSDEGWKLPALADYRVATVKDVIDRVRAAVGRQEVAQ